MTIGALTDVICEAFTTEWDIDVTADVRQREGECGIGATVGSGSRTNGARVNRNGGEVPWQGVGTPIA